MQIVKPIAFIAEVINGLEMLRRIEMAGRTCYKSEDKATEDSASRFVEMIIKRGHETVLEHEKVSVRVLCDRGVSHEIVRHRIASYSQESTRYCNYGKAEDGIQVIEPPGLDILSKGIWLEVCSRAEHAYLTMLAQGVSPQIARSVLPTCLKTELVMTMNLREWRHFFKLRTAKDAHPQMREIMIPLLGEFKEAIPVVFDDIFVA